MATVVIFATNDGQISSTNASYATCRAGSNLGTNLFQLQAAAGFNTPTFVVAESFLDFDTSSIVAPVRSAVLSLYNPGATFAAGVAPILRVRLQNYGSSLENADWVNPNAASGLTLLAQIAQTAFIQDQHNDLTSVALAANLNLSGSTRMIMMDDFTEGGTSPTGSLNTQWNAINSTGVASQRPKLTVTFGPPSVDRHVFRSFPKYRLRRRA